MTDYVIFTDSACDIKSEVLKEWGVEFECLCFHFEGEEKVYSNIEMENSEFYAKMKAGGVAKTSAINPETFTAAFEKILASGRDILYLGFSSGLSTTCNFGRIAAEELAGKYPERKLMVVDTLSASAGEGLIVWLTSKKQKEGATIEEAAEYARSLAPKLCHWLTVDDLEYLKRGGRVSPTVAFVGKALGIKPILCVDNEGKLVSHSKARGRKAALVALVQKYGEQAENPAGGTPFICHADCPEDAELLKAMLKETHGADVAHIAEIGAVIGAHAGPGTIAVLFVGKER